MNDKPEEKRAKVITDFIIKNQTKALCFFRDCVLKKWSLRDSCHGNGS
jgi:hypothetical protein